MNSPRLEVDIYQLVDDGMLMKNRSDGTGWDWCWADWQRDWMNATPFRYAYRCLPLTIANQTGWWIKNPAGFTAVWNGRTEPHSIQFQFDVAGDVWSPWINSQFGEGIITWNTPFLFRTKPEGSRLLICGAPNYFKANAHPLTAIIESDWITMSFTMNWRLMTPGQPVRFEVGEPLFQAIPLASNICLDLEQASVTYQRLSDDPKLTHDYNEWTIGRRKFHEQKAAGEVKGNDWQKDYFQGRDALGREVASHHMTKVKPPQIRLQGSLKGMAPVGGEHRPTDRPAPAASAPSHNGGSTHSGPAASAMDRSQGGARPAGACPIDHSSYQTGPAMSRIEDAAAIGVMELPVGQSVEIQAKPISSDDHREVTQAVGMEQSAALQAQEVPVKSFVGETWRRWIAENLILGNPPAELVESMKATGIPEAEAFREVELAVKSPYLKGVELLQNRLAKRDWLFATYRKLNRMNSKSSKIERRHKLPRQEFLDEYYSTNRPVIITGMIDDWPAMRKWNLDFFERTFAGREIELQMGRDSSPNYETESAKFVKKVLFDDFIRMLRTAGQTNDFYLTANNNSANKQVLPELWRDITQIPEYLTQDPNAGFLWIGPPGTITPFHHDLTNNFMAQVIGRKLLKLAHSWDTPVMFNELHCFSRIDGRLIPPSPQTQRLDEPQILEVVLEPGEVLFLPIGCWHYVQGLDLSVTISFTNFVFDNDFSSFYKTYCPV